MPTKVHAPKRNAQVMDERRRKMARVVRTLRELADDVAEDAQKTKRSWDTEQDLVDASRLVIQCYNRIRGESVDVEGMIQLINTRNTQRRLRGHG